MSRYYLLAEYFDGDETRAHILSSKPFETIEDAEKYFDTDNFATLSELRDMADRIKRQEYYDDVRDHTTTIREEVESGNYLDHSDLIERIDEDADGAQRVIYTGQAMQCLVYSDNDTAGLDELGADGFDWKNGIPWSQLAYFAFRQDIIEHLGFDVNDPKQHYIETLAESGRIEAAIKTALLERGMAEKSLSMLNPEAFALEGLSAEEIAEAIADGDECEDIEVTYTDTEGEEHEVMLDIEKNDDGKLVVTSIDEEPKEEAIG